MTKFINYKCSNQNYNTLHNKTKPVLYTLKNSLKNMGNSNAGKSILNNLHLDFFGTLSLWYGMSQGLKNLYIFAEKRGFIPQQKKRGTGAGMHNVLLYLLKHTAILTLILMYEGKLIRNPAELTTKTSSISGNMNQIEEEIRAMSEKIIYDYNNGINNNLSQSELDQIKYIIETNPILKKFIKEGIFITESNHLTNLQTLINDLININ